MKRIFLLLCVIFALPVHATEVYRFDPTHTYVIWRVDHFGFSNLTGKCMADGKIFLDEHNLRGSKVSVRIHTATMTTGIPALDNVLKGQRYFSVEHHPIATFTSQRLIISGKNTGKVLGVLTIKGISHPVTLNIKLNRYGIHPYYKRKALGFTGRTTIHRSDYYMDYFTPGVGDEVHIYIQAEALLQ